MTIEAWPFIVANSPHNEYRAIVAPQFLCERGTEQLLKMAAATEVTGWSNGIVKKIPQCRDPELGSLTIVFRSMEPHREELGIGGNQRREKITEGFVLREPWMRRMENGGATALSAEQFDRVRQVYLPIYREFWHDRQAQPPTVASRSVSLVPVLPSTPMELKREADFHADRIELKKNPNGFRPPIEASWDQEGAPNPSGDDGAMATLPPTRADQPQVEDEPDDPRKVEKRPVLLLAFGLGVVFGLSFAYIMQSLWSCWKAR